MCQNISFHVLYVLPIQLAFQSGRVEPYPMRRKEVLLSAGLTNFATVLGIHAVLEVDHFPSALRTEVACPPPERADGVNDAVARRHQCKVTVLLRRRIPGAPLHNAHVHSNKEGLPPGGTSMYDVHAEGGGVKKCSKYAAKL